MAEPLPSLDLFDRATLRTVVERAASALRTGKGFSLIRLGDGEGPVLCWPDHQLPGEMATVLQTWFGSDIPSDVGLLKIADGLRHAVRSADVLGLPTRYQLTRTPRYEMVFDGIDRHRLCSPSQLFADSGIHFYLQWAGALAYLLRNRDSVDVITCRDISIQIAEAFNLRSVRTWLIRGEHLHPGVVLEPHWPNTFNKIVQQLESAGPGRLFLVGAGVLGKIYCDRIKARGAVALDIGSILDSWAMIPSRDPFKVATTAYGLGHHKLIGTDWESMMTCLRRCAAELHSRDATVTL